MAFALALLLASRQDGPTPAAVSSPPSHIIVTTVAGLDAQRLADALRTYLDEVDITVDPRPASTTDGLRQQLQDARRVGQAALATAVVRVDRAASDAGHDEVEHEEVQIELIDLATNEVLIATVASPARDEDRYRALALKIEAMVRARWSVARAGSGARDASPRDLDALSATRLASQPPSNLALDVGLALVSFPIAGPLLDGLDVRARWLPSARVAVTVGTALLGSASASKGGVDAVATLVPVRASAMLRLAAGRAALYAGPSAELSYLRIAASSDTTPVRSVHHVMVALGGEAEARLVLASPLWLFARAGAFGVLNGERYDAAGVPLIDTSRFELAGTIGLALAVP